MEQELRYVEAANKVTHMKWGPQVSAPIPAQVPAQVSEKPTKVWTKRLEKALEQWEEAKEQVEQNKFDDTVLQEEEDFAVAIDNKMHRSPRNKKRKNWVYTGKSERNPMQKKIQKTSRARAPLPHNQKKDRLVKEQQVDRPNDLPVDYTDCDLDYRDRDPYPEDSWSGCCYAVDMRCQFMDRIETECCGWDDWDTDSESDGGMRYDWRNER